MERKNEEEHLRKLSGESACPVNHPSVKVLFVGYSHVDPDDSSAMKANCTCSLIRGPPNVIVDTMTAWNGPDLLKALKSEGLTPEDIDYVICTHGHSDHIGCNYLFLESKHIVGFSISHKTKYYDHDFKSGLELIISDKIRVVPTPGHTLQDVSVIVNTGPLQQGLIALTGDLFENEQDLTDASIWKTAGSDNEILQHLNRKKVLELVDYIVPGHGAMFKVQK